MARKSADFPLFYEVTDVAFSADGLLLASASADKSIKAWAVDPSECKWRPRGLDAHQRRLQGGLRAYRV